MKLSYRRYHSRCPNYLLRPVNRSGVLSTSSLCIERGKSVWVLYIDATCINYDGNAFDATLIAMVAALKNSTIFPLAPSCTPMFISIFRVTQPNSPKRLTTKKPAEQHALGKQCCLSNSVAYLYRSPSASLIRMYRPLELSFRF